MPDWRPLGTHQYVIEEDLLHWKLRGPVLPEDIRQLWELNGSLRKQFGYVLLLIDGNEAGMMTPESRKTVVEMKRKDPDSIGRVAAFGMGPLSGGLIALVIRAVALVTKKEISLIVCPSEAAARLWLSQARLSARAAAARGPVTTQ